MEKFINIRTGEVIHAMMQFGAWFIFDGEMQSGKRYFSKGIESDKVFSEKYLILEK